MQRLNLIAVLAGLVALPVIYGVLNILAHLVVDHPAASPATWALVAPIGAVVLWLAPGCVTGYLAKEAPVKHGIALGTAIVVVVLAGVLVGEKIGLPDLVDELPYVVGFAVPIALGSILGALLGRRLARRP